MVNFYRLLVITSFALTLNSFELIAAEPQAEVKTETKPIAQSSPIAQTVLGMNVSGTKDLPNVLYIIPWKDNGEPVRPPKVTRLVDEIYAPVDPDVFAKQVKFYYQLTDKAQVDTPKE